MRINNKILSIPPYISTSWKQIASLKAEKKEGILQLHITLQDGSYTLIPQIESPIVDAIFSSHAKYLESETPQEKQPPVPFFFETQRLSSSALLEPPFPLPFPGFKNLTSLLQHDSERSLEVNFPKEMLDKIENLTRAMGIEDLRLLPKEEPHCNCPHCQIARSMKKAFEDNIETEESGIDLDEEVTEQDLLFKSWHIYPLENQNYKVVHPDNKDELYHVSLGSPLSCSCGSNQCEHIRSVLSS